MNKDCAEILMNYKTNASWRKMRIAIWGISKTLTDWEKCPYWLDNSYISLYIDSDKKWISQNYQGKEVIHPNSILSRKDDFDFILISTPKYQDEIISIARKSGLQHRLLPTEIIFPFIELHFNEVLCKLLSSEHIGIIKNWYVDGNNRSIIFQINSLIGQNIMLWMFPKWCFGRREIDMDYKLENVQNGIVEAQGKFDINRPISIHVHNNLSVYKLTTTGLNSSFLTVDFGQEQLKRGADRENKIVESVLNEK